MKETKILGIDIGGSHITACMVDISSSMPEEQTFVRRKVNPHGTAEETITTWAACIQSCFDQYPLIKEKHIGIAMPGPFDYEKGISYITGLNKFEALYGLPIKELLAARLSIPPENIRMLNDASAFLLGEMMMGAGRGYAKSAGITLGTGAGSAVYFDGNVHDGDMWCTPFKTSRAEDYLCSRWFVVEYAAVSGNQVNEVRELIDVFDTDPFVRPVFAKFSHHLAEVLLMKYPPEVQEVIIIGGNVSKAWNYFIPETLLYFEKKGVVMNLQPAILGENAAIAGAAFLWR